MVRWKRRWLLVLIACLIAAGCTEAGYQPAPDDHTEPTHRDGGGGGAM
ncbi:MAG TPA: hypothetical protein VGQ90_06865 [Stellaceae bacterium]|nr:hypothetical protein [Stellaceae bacterium]